MERATGFEPATLGLGNRSDRLSPPTTSFANVRNLRQYRVLQSLEISPSFVAAPHRSPVKRWLQRWWIRRVIRWRPVDELAVEARGDPVTGVPFARKLA